MNGLQVHSLTYDIPSKFLTCPCKCKGFSINQAHAGLRLVRTWFLKFDPVRNIGMRVRVCVRVCPRPRLLITNGMIWHKMNLI